MNQIQEFHHEYAERWVHAPDAFDQKGGLYVIHLGHNIAKSNYSSGPRQTGHYTFHFVREGEVEFWYGDHRVVLSKGDMFCKFPHETYTYKLHPSPEPLRMVWLAFNGSQAAEMMAMSGFTAETMYRTRVLDQDMELLLRQVVQTPKQMNKKHLAQLNGLLYRIYGLLIPESHDGASAQTKDYWVQKSLDFIHSFYAEKINVNDIATYVGVHRTHFSKTFTEEVGLPPAAYLQNVRMDKAGRLLRRTRLSVTEIALSVGYMDLYPFTRAFTRQFGCSPSRYRQTAAPRKKDEAPNSR
ncbi:helix-turn-helix domain-containing protein [Paenibacillus solanacearum]|uniref:helix-turn-helix domain-containing protein n=1 Tax=Paenibacillus solanacearum TaxID=2048548 RepID=UPI001C4036ED|nr:AraC family transcriptional regulator [Paenibacillus solanacearum]